MSRKPRKKPGIPRHNTLGKSLPAARTNGSDTTERSETSGNEQENDDSSLTFRQQSVLPTVAVSHSIAQASRDSGVAESTLRRWLSDPSFRSELARVRQEYQVLSRQQALAGIPIGMSVIVELATGAEDKALRFRAARFLVEHGNRQGNIERLSDDLLDLQEAIQSSDNTNQLA